MQQNPKPLLIIDSRYALYDSRQKRTYKYNTVLQKSFILLQQHFQILVIFCHSKPNTNEFFYNEFHKNFQGIDSKQLSIQELKVTSFPNEDIIVVTHNYEQFTLQQKYQLYYFSSVSQHLDKKRQLELKYYESNPKPSFHISHIQQVMSYFSKSQNPFTVGYYFYPKKFNELIQFDALISNANFNYIPMDFRFYNKYIQINVLFHRVMDIYKKKEINMKQNEVELFQQNYDKFVTENAEIPVIDQVECLKTLIQRDELNVKLQSIFASPQFQNAVQEHHIKIMTPEQVLYDNIGEPQELQNLKYPLIVKSKQGALTANCHIMAIVVNEKGLRELFKHEQFKGQLILQQIINHNSIIYKIYQLGSKMIVQKRKSIPNIEIHNFKFEEGFYIFDTQKDLFKNVSQCLKEVDEGVHECSNEDQLLKQMELLSSIIAKEFKLHLFGFDIIGMNWEFYIIDINHFPGYKNVENARELFEQLFLQVSKK
ncbi:unnamed protein product (macronuclear) [Paramecium tetraurelia]|uniref:inositol-1,3,4-trisphosphate 5/6-kinase n=1 Tax=Paramecium tetraurelia TaxID=5888 RepID=A0C3Z0_PARTE|nr:uncharacterized protein GSPATT00034987001 [Paramecium tetraurelia]CAK65507.1 unnamed protein product [Paramecium tetraurelia]|eukprot:XP_001432904.1 hypothetical protein (macronuclear) [Paramecium tetraurelia strain d4-2]